MTKYVLITTIVILGLFSTLGCNSYDRLDRMEAQLDTLTNRLQASQQELTASREALIRAQERASYLEAQLEQTKNNTYNTGSCPTCPEAQTVVVTEPVYTPYRYYSGYLLIHYPGQKNRSLSPGFYLKYHRIFSNKCCFP